MSIHEISYLGLFLCLSFVVFAGLFSYKMKLGLEKDIIIGTIRCYLQLFALGYALRYLFKVDNPFILIAVFCFMIYFAVFTIKQRVKEKSINYFYPVFLTMLISYLAITVFVLGVIIRLDPWYQPIYFLPIGGMIIGNSMNAIAISIDRLLADFKKDKNGIEMELALGANYIEATEDHFKNAILSGMIPSINALMSVGIVFIPGMMTGQVLAGVDPAQAIRYQIMIMLLLVSITTVGSILVVFIVRKLCFNSFDQLLFID